MTTIEKAVQDVVDELEEAEMRIKDIRKHIEKIQEEEKYNQLKQISGKIGKVETNTSWAFIRTKDARKKNGEEVIHKRPKGNQ